MGLSHLIMPCQSWISHSASTPWIPSAITQRQLRPCREKERERETLPLPLSATVQSLPTVFFSFELILKDNRYLTLIWLREKKGRVENLNFGPKFQRLFTTPLNSSVSNPKIHKTRYHFHLHNLADDLFIQSNSVIFEILRRIQHMRVFIDLGTRSVWENLTCVREWMKVNRRIKCECFVNLVKNRNIRVGPVVALQQTWNHNLHLTYKSQVAIS